ncbi:MAG: hypothetical protein WC466_09425 [Candidatus Izemoplasmatales bacterium]
MILKNNQPKGRYFVVKINGVPKKVWIKAFGEYDLSNIDSRFESANSLNGLAYTKAKGFGVLLNSHAFSLLSNSEKGKNFTNFVESSVFVEQEQAGNLWDYDGIITASQDWSFNVGYRSDTSLGSADPDSFPESSSGGKFCYHEGSFGTINLYVSKNVQTLLVNDKPIDGGVYDEENDLTTYTLDNAIFSDGQAATVKVKLN